MIELVILDLVLLLGIAVVPRYASRSFLAVRRMARESLREVTAREPVAAPVAARALLGRTGRAAREAVTGARLRPVLLPAAAALVAAAGIASYAARAGPDGVELPAEATASEAGVLYLPSGASGEDRVLPPPAPRREVACEEALEATGDLSVGVRVRIL